MTGPRRLALGRVPGGGFTPTDIDAAGTWSARQRDCGMRADMAGEAPEDNSVLEVFGPDDMVPHCIMYPTHAGIQVDEFTGESRIYACLESALREIAPLH